MKPGSLNFLEENVLRVDHGVVREKEGKVPEANRYLFLVYSIFNFLTEDFKAVWQKSFCRVGIKDFFTVFKTFHSFAISENYIFRVVIKLVKLCLKRAIDVEKLNLTMSFQ